MGLRAGVGSFERRIPFVIAVTGHRDLRSADLDPLKSRVRQVLKEIAASIPSTPLLVLTGLAEGSDQLVAQVAVEIGIEIAAVVPMPIGLYSEQMAAGARSELNDLYAKATLKIDLPMDDVSEEQLRNCSTVRDDRYDKLAAYMISHSQALIALWDGKETGLKGGTSEVVRQFEAPELLEGSADVKVVYHIVTPRISNSDVPNAFRLHQRWPEGKGTSASKREFETVKRELNRFNQSAAEQDGAESVAQVGEGLLDAAHHLSLSTFLCRVAVAHRRADFIALSFGKKRNQFLILILTLALAGIFGLELHSNIFPHLDYLWLVFPLSASAAVGLYRWARKLRVEDQFLDSRSLAEALRVQFYWGLSGIEVPVSEQYLQHYQGSIGWIRTSLQNIFLFHDEDSGKAFDKAGLQATLTCWVKSQEWWYGKKARQQSRTLARLEQIANRSLGSVVTLSFLIAFSLLLPGPWQNAWQTRVHEHLNGILHLLIAVPSVAIGIFKIWVEQAGYDEQVRNYSHMARVFSHSARELEEHLDAGRLSDARDVIRELGKQALQENGSWLIMHREHPLKVVGP